MTDRYADLAGKEVILSAGALDTPKILMLSGIGDKGELQTHDIDTVQHLPGVGKNLQDHTFTVLMYEQKVSLSYDEMSCILTVH